MLPSASCCGKPRVNANGNRVLRRIPCCSRVDLAAAFHGSTRVVQSGTILVRLRRYDVPYNCARMEFCVRMHAYMCVCLRRTNAICFFPLRGVITLSPVIDVATSVQVHGLDQGRPTTWPRAEPSGQMTHAIRGKGVLGSREAHSPR